MIEFIELPQVVRACPECQGEMRAERATLGGGWGGHGVRILYACDSCGNRILRESDRSYSLAIFCGGALLLVGIPLALFLAAPSNIVFGVIVALLGSGGVWIGLTAGNEAPVLYIENDKAPRKSEIEDNLFLSEEEAAWNKKIERILTWAIFGVLVLLIITGFWELTAWMIA